MYNFLHYKCVVLILTYIFSSWTWHFPLLLFWKKFPMSHHLYHYANSSLLFMRKWILLSEPGVNVQLKASAMCSKVNQALALYTKGPVIFIMLNNTLSWELSSPHIPGQLLVSIIVYLSRGKINQNALGPLLWTCNTDWFVWTKGSALLWQIVQ